MSDERVERVRARIAGKIRAHGSDFSDEDRDILALCEDWERLEKIAADNEINFKSACKEIDRLTNEDELVKRVTQLEDALGECEAFDAPAELVAERAKVAALEARTTLTDSEKRLLDHVEEYKYLSDGKSKLLFDLAATIRRLTHAESDGAE